MLRLQQKEDAVQEMSQSHQQRLLDLQQELQEARDQLAEEVQFREKEVAKLEAEYVLYFV